MTEPLVRKTEIARLLGGVSPQTIDRWVQRGMPAMKAGAAQQAPVLFDVAACREWLAQARGADPRRASLELAVRTRQRAARVKREIAGLPRPEAAAVLADMIERRDHLVAHAELVDLLRCLPGARETTAWALLERAGVDRAYRLRDLPSGKAQLLAEVVREHGEARA